MGLEAGFGRFGFVRVCRCRAYGWPFVCSAGGRPAGDSGASVGFGGQDSSVVRPESADGEESENVPSSSSAGRRGCGRRP